MKSLLLSLVFSFLALIPQPANNATLEQSFPPPSISTILSDDHSWTASVSANQKFTLLVTGDILTARTIEARSQKTGDYLYPFKNTSSLLSSADVTLVNLETPLTSNCPVITTGTVFCGRPENATALKTAGVDIVSLANNHAYDQKLSGFKSTEEILESSGLKVTHQNKPARVIIHNTPITFLSYNDIYDMSGKFKPIDLEFLRSEISKAKENSPLVIVLFHWGNEYTLKITPRHKLLAHTAIDSGANLIVGNHPHWVQPLEIYKDKLIVYSHGNFVFDQYWSQTTKEGVVGLYTFIGPNLIDAKYTAIEMLTNGQTIVSSPPNSQKILDRLRPKSATKI